MTRTVQSWLKLNLRNIKFIPSEIYPGRSESTSVLIFEICDKINAEREAYINGRGKEERMQEGKGKKEKIREARSY